MDDDVLDKNLLNEAPCSIYEGIENLETLLTSKEVIDSITCMDSAMYK